MSICVNRINENLRATLERDNLDCKEKCLRGYLRKNQSLFKEKLPSLKSHCCCRHLVVLEGKRQDNFPTGSLGTEGQVFVNNRNTGLRKQNPTIYVREGRSQRINKHPTKHEMNGVYVASETFKGGLNTHKHNKIRDKRKLASQLVLNSNNFETGMRNHSILLKSSKSNNSDCEEESNYQFGNELFLKSQLPSIGQQKSITEDCEKQILSRCVMAGPRRLVCFPKDVSDNNSIGKLTHHSILDEMDYNRVTPKDLIHFKVVPYNNTCG